MAFDTYANFRTAVRNKLSVDSTVLPDDDVADMVRMVEDEIYANCRLPEMRVSESFTYSDGGIDVETFSQTPLQLISIAVQISSNEIKTPNPVSEYVLNSKLTADGNPAKPEVWGWQSPADADGTPKLVIAPEPVDYDVVVAYWARFASLVTAVNIVYSTYAPMWFAGVVAEAFLHQQDAEMYAIWRNKFETAMANAQRHGRGKNESFQGNLPIAGFPAAVP